MSLKATMQEYLVDFRPSETHGEKTSETSNYNTNILAAQHGHVD